MSSVPIPELPQYRVTLFFGPEPVKARPSRVCCVFNVKKRSWKGGVQIAVEFLDPDGHHLELYWGVDQVGSDGRVRPPEEWRQTACLEDAVRIAPPGQDTTLHDKALSDRIGTGTDRA